MDEGNAAGAELASATTYGVVCARAAEGQRDLQECTRRYPDLFPVDPFDATLLNSVALAVAGGAPWLQTDELRIANRAALWVFGLDRTIDHLAGSPDEVAIAVKGCLAVGSGGPPQPGDGLTEFLADIRDALTDMPSYPALLPAWRIELDRMLAAMAREWIWKSERDLKGLPTVEEYLANADNFGSSFVNVVQWGVGFAEPLDRLTDLLSASRAVQRVLRLVNDLATFDREMRWGDLNVLMLGRSRAEVSEMITTLLAESMELLRPLRSTHPRIVTYLERQLGFSLGFYRVSDYWSTP
jgi:hypothetical protein